MLLSNEEKIICLFSRLKPSSEDIKRAKQIVTFAEPCIDYRKLLRLAALNGVAPLIYNNLKDINIFPEQVLSTLRNAYLFSVAENLRKSAALIGLLDLLKHRGIKAIPIKGVIASELIFENPGFYYGSDIDVLVKPSELRAVKHILIDSGYTYNEANETDMLSSHYHLVFQDGPHLVEVHWNLVKRYFNIPPEFWWEDIIFQKYQGQEILCLSPEKYLMCTIFRLFSHMFHPFKFFVLVSELSNKYYESIDWNRFATFTQKYGMDKLTTFSLKLSNELLGTKIPDKILKKHIFGYELFKRSIMNQLFGDVGRPHLGKPLYTFLLDSPFNIFRHFLMRVFPVKSELRLRYEIPQGSRSIFLYYALNPILLPALILRKRLEDLCGKPKN